MASRIWLAVIILIMPIFTGCAKNIDESGINVHFAVTGATELFDYDDSYLKGIDMAIEDCNNEYNKDGFNITMQFFDDETIYEKGVVISNLIASDSKVTAVLGSQSFHIINSAAEIFENSKKILIAPHGANDETLNEGYKYLFRNTHSANDMGVSLAKYAKEMGYSKIAVCTQGAEYEAAVVRGFYTESSNSDLRIVDYISNVKTQDEFDITYERWELLGVDCVVIVQYSELDAFDLLERVRSKNPDMPILGDFSFDFKEMLEEYRNVSENIVIAELLSVEQGEKAKIFKSRYLEKYNEIPTNYAIQGYDSVRMIVDTAVRLGTNDTAELARELHNSEYKGVSGTIKFDKNGRLIKHQPNLLISKDCMFGGFGNE